MNTVKIKKNKYVKTYTLKDGIENILKDMLPGKIKVVEAVNA